jgi:hypothetical protein
MCTSFVVCMHFEQEREGLQSYLSTTRRVLSGTTRNKLRIKVINQVIVKSKVLLLGKNSIIGLQSVFLEELLVTDVIGLA